MYERADVMQWKIDEFYLLVVSYLYIHESLSIRVGMLFDFFTSFDWKADVLHLYEF